MDNKVARLSEYAYRGYSEEFIKSLSEALLKQEKVLREAGIDLLTTEKKRQN